MASALMEDIDAALMGAPAAVPEGLGEEAQEAAAAAAAVMEAEAAAKAEAEKAAAAAAQAALAFYMRISFCTETEKRTVSDDEA